MPTLLGPLERANLNHWTETDPVSETSFFFFWHLEFQTIYKVDEVILSVTRHRQHLSDSRSRDLFIENIWRKSVRKFRRTTNTLAGKKQIPVRLWVYWYQ
jgi:hypothetical protein